MRENKIEKDFIVNGFRCVIIGQSMGHRCGYIEIPTHHKFYGVDYDNINIDVHGGWTYSDYTYKNYPVKSNDNSWWIGFDCGHLGDAKDIELIKSFGDNETSRFWIEMENNYPEHGTVRTMEYVEHELIKAAQQIALIEH